MAQLCQRQRELEQQNLEVVVISFGVPPFARAWLEETCHAFRLLLDPKRSVYRAFGLERSLWRSWNPRTVWHYAGLLLNGRRWRGIQGDSAQLGGDFVIDTHGIVQLAYRSHDPTDRPPVDSLLNVLESRG